MNKKIASKLHTYLVWIHVKRWTLAVEQKKNRNKSIGVGDLFTRNYFTY